MRVAIGITGLKEHINVGRIIEINGIRYKVLSVADCEIEDRQGQKMICEVILPILSLRRFGDDSM